MPFLKVELFKLLKSPFVMIGSLLSLSLVAVLYVGLVVKGADISALQFCTMALGNILNLGVFPLSVVIAASTAFASEFSYGTLRYIRMRPVSWAQLLGSKTVVCLLYAAGLGTAIFLVSFIAGHETWPHTPLVSREGTVLTSQALRVGLFYGVTVINQVFLIALSLFFSVIVKNQSSAMLCAYSVFVLILIFVPEGFAAFSPKTILLLKPFLISEEIQYLRILLTIVVSVLYSAVLSGGALFLVFHRKEKFV
ncbi:MAG: ABC transporter permease [Spirochaetia bacterium]